MGKAKRLLSQREGHKIFQQTRDAQTKIQCEGYEIYT